MSNSFRSGVGLVLAVVAVLAASYRLGYTHAGANCKSDKSDAQLQAQGQVIRQARGDIQRSAAVGRAREADSAHVDAFFQRLAEEAAHATPDPVDRCVLPDERLRRWAAANAGPAASSPAAGQHDSATPASAAAALGPGAGPGGEPPGGGAPLSPAGQPLLPAAPASAADAR